MPLRRWLGARRSEPSRAALFVDGPNVLRGEFDVDLDALRSSAANDGRVDLARVYLDEHASPGLIRAAEAHGFEVVVTSGDVDVKLAIDAMELIASTEWDVLAVASRDIDFKPVLERAAYHGMATVAIAPTDEGRSAGLAECADEAVILS